MTQDEDFLVDLVVKSSPCNAEDMDSIQGQGAKIPHTFWPKKQNRKQKQYCNKFNKDLKNCLYQKSLKKKIQICLAKSGGSRLQSQINCPCLMGPDSGKGLKYHSQIVMINKIHI